MKGMSTVISEETKSLKDGRILKIQTWTEAGTTFITYFFSIKGLEDKSPEELYYFLKNEDVALPQPFSKGKIVAQKFSDDNKELCWGLTIFASKIIEK